MAAGLVAGAGAAAGLVGAGAAAGLVAGAGAGRTVTGFFGSSCGSPPVVNALAF